MVKKQAKLRISLQAPASLALWVVLGMSVNVIFLLSGMTRVLPHHAATDEELSFALPDVIHWRSSLFSSSSSSNNKDDAFSFYDYDATKLPPWLNEYRLWHAEQRKDLTFDNWDDPDRRYLIVSCAHVDGMAPKCGGTSDRLRNMPLMLRLAYRSKRLLLIHWTRPCRLETFLLPNLEQDGIDWTVPNWMETKILHTQKHLQSAKIGATGERLVGLAMKSEYQMVKARIQLNDGGLELYGSDETLFPPLLKEDGLNQTASSDNMFQNDILRRPKGANLNEDKFHLYPQQFYTYYHDMFRMMFRPAPMVGASLQKHLRLTSDTKDDVATTDKSKDFFRLTPGKYTAVHHRAYYFAEGDIEQIRSRQIVTQTMNAIHCAVALNPDQPIYFASDSIQATEIAYEYGKVNNVQVVIRKPLEMDKHPEADVYTEQSSEVGTESVTKQQLGGFWHLDMVDRTHYPHTAIGAGNYYYNTSASIPEDKWQHILPHLVETFVDMYLMASGNCVAHGNGGFGVWASWISYDYSCIETHLKLSRMLKCPNPFD